MKPILKLTLVIALLVISVSGCIPGFVNQAYDETSTPSMAEETEILQTTMDSSENIPTQTPSVSMSVETPDWFRVNLTNVTTGEIFTIEDFSGKVVLIETMAQNCSSCWQQQGQVRSLIEKTTGSSDLIVVILDIDPNDTEDSLKTYVDTNGFLGFYAVSPVEVSRDISNLYGAQFLNPPSTPMLIIDRGGEVHLLPFGIKSEEDLFNAVNPFLDNM
jgi:hypothetical protein